MLSRLLILCLVHPLSLCLPHDAHFRAGMVLYAPSIATRVPLHWISKEFALCSYDMSHCVSGPVNFLRPIPTSFILLHLGFGVPTGVWPCGWLVHSFGQRCTMPLDHMLYAMGCARHGHPSAWGCTLLSHECPGPIWVVTTSTTAHVQRAPGNHPKPSETNRQKLSHYDRIYFALLALYLHQWAYLKPFWHFTCINEHISNVCPFGIRLHSDLSSLFWYFGIFGTWPYYFGSLISLLIIKSWSSSTHCRIAQCPSVLTSADNLLKCIWSSSALSNIHGYFIHSRASANGIRSILFDQFNLLSPTPYAQNGVSRYSGSLSIRPVAWLLPLAFAVLPQFWLDHFHHICLLSWLIFQLPTALPYLLACIKVAHRITAQLSGFSSTKKRQNPLHRLCTNLSTTKSMSSLFPNFIRISLIMATLHPTLLTLRLQPICSAPRVFTKSIN